MPRSQQTPAAAYFERAVELDPEFADTPLERRPGIWCGSTSACPPMDLGRPELARVEPQCRQRRSALGTGNREHPSMNGTTGRRNGSRAAMAGSTQPYLSLAHLLSNIGRHDEALVEVRRAGRSIRSGRSSERSKVATWHGATRIRWHVSMKSSRCRPQLSAAHIMRTYPLLALQRRCEDAIRSSDKALEA